MKSLSILIVTAILGTISSASADMICKETQMLALPGIDRTQIDIVTLSADLGYAIVRGQPKRGDVKTIAVLPYVGKEEGLMVFKSDQSNFSVKFTNVGGAKAALIYGKEGFRESIGMACSINKKLR